MIEVASLEEARELLRDLTIYKAELESQNEELRKVQAQFEDERNRYSDLYDFAPVSYFSFDEDGLIREANLTGVRLMGRDRLKVINKPFIDHLEPQSRQDFIGHLKKVIESGESQTIELVVCHSKTDGQEEGCDLRYV
jgi:PAS domain-containing protein